MAFNFHEQGKDGMGRKSDLRSQVSQRLIWDAMFGLLSEKPFDSVHVKDICNRANINRSTFYNHFMDKYELLQFGLHEVILKEAGIAVDDGPLTEPPHSKLFAYVHEHQDFWKNVFGTPRARDFVNETIIESSESFFQQVKPLPTKGAGGIDRSAAATRTEAERDAGIAVEAEQGTAATTRPGADIPASIVARMYFGAVGNLTMWWLTENCATPIDDLNAWIDSVWNFDTQL